MISNILSKAVDGSRFQNIVYVFQFFKVITYECTITMNICDTNVKKSYISPFRITVHVGVHLLYYYAVIFTSGSQCNITPHSIYPYRGLYGLLMVTSDV